MAFTLQLADADGNPLSEAYAILDDELLAYFSDLDGFPALQNLGNLPSGKKTPIQEETHEILGLELEEMAELIKRREVPQPPDWVGLEESGDIRLGEEFGWQGLLAFLCRLTHLLHLRQTMGMEMWLLPVE